MQERTRHRPLRSTRSSLQLCGWDGLQRAPGVHQLLTHPARILVLEMGATGGRIAVNGWWLLWPATPTPTREQVHRLVLGEAARRCKVKLFPCPHQPQ